VNALIEIFRMNEVSVQTRIKLIKKLGNAINNEYAMNITEPLVYELILALDPENEIKNDPGYSKATL
jgi:hypothetical protein